MKSGVFKLTLLSAMLAFTTVSQSVEARKWTITQRQVAEQARINSGEKSGELTKKEADGLRSDMTDISDRIAKMKSKNGGKLSYDDQGKVEKDLNKVTLKIEKMKLDKRVTPK